MTFVNEPKNSVLDAMRSRIDELSKSERRVARVLLNGSPIAGLTSSTRLAHVAGVSGPTVIRFTRRLGFDSYSDFQAALSLEIGDRFTSPPRLLAAGGNPLPAAGIEGEAADGVLGATLAQLDRASLQSCVKLLGADARAVFTCGGWFSHVLARHLAGLLQEVRPRVRYVENTPQDRVNSLAEADHLTTVCVFDFRRYETDVHRWARGMVDAGSRLLLVTDPWLSPLVDVANRVLVSHVGSPRPFESHIGTMAVVERLVNGVIEADPEAGRDYLSHFNEKTEIVHDDWTT